MRYKRDFYFVQYNGETKQECVNNLKVFNFWLFMEVSKTKIWIKQKQWLLWESYVTAYFTEKYCYIFGISFVKYPYVIRDKRHVTFSVYLTDCTEGRGGFCAVRI